MYNISNFLGQISDTDKNLIIYDSNGVLKKILNPFTIRNTILINNLIKISLNSGKDLILNFSTTNEAKLALNLLQQNIDILKSKLPEYLDKSIKNYIEDLYINLPTGPQGLDGPTGPFGATGDIGPQGLDGPTGAPGMGAVGNNDVGVMYLKNNTTPTIISVQNDRYVVSGTMSTGILYNFIKDPSTNSLKYTGVGGRFHIIATFNFLEGSQNTCGFYIGHNTDDTTPLNPDADRISESEIYINSSTPSNQPVGGAIQTVLDLQTNDRVFFIVQNRDAATNITVQFLKFATLSLTSEIGPTGSIENVKFKNINNDYTLNINDSSFLIDAASSSNIIVTVPLNSSVPFETGTQILLVRSGTGSVGVTSSVGVTLNSAQGYLNLNYQYSAATLVKKNTDTWYVFGDLKS